jgi:preprotein translocase subunit Sec63
MIRWSPLEVKRYRDRLAMMAAMAPHELLGVAADATIVDVRAAYVRMVKAYHPDKSDPFMTRHNEEVLKLKLVRGCLLTPPLSFASYL